MSAPVQPARAAAALRRYVVVVSLASVSAVALFALSMAGASIILAMLSGVPIGTVEPFVASELPSMALAALFFFTLNGVLVATVIALARGFEVVSFVRSDVAFVAASTGLAIGLAPIAVLAARFSPL